MGRKLANSRVESKTKVHYTRRREKKTSWFLGELTSARRGRQFVGRKKGGGRKKLAERGKKGDWG